MTVGESSKIWQSKQTHHLIIIYSFIAERNYWIEIIEEKITKFKTLH